MIVLGVVCDGVTCDGVTCDRVTCDGRRTYSMSNLVGEA
jgi:hypothetical protein